MPTDRKPLSSYRSPDTWPVWIGLALLWLICRLPHRFALWIGRQTGRLAWLVAGSRRAVVLRNLELCFPDLDAANRNALAKRHFEALGMAIIEMGDARFRGEAFHRRIGRLVGKEHIEAARRDGSGIILLSAHFTTIEIMGTLLRFEIGAFDAVYRMNRSDFMTELLRSGREKSAESTIEKRDIKAMVRGLKNGRIVWYAPDQSYDRKGSEVVPFFGVPSMHTTATSTLARLGNVKVVPFFPRRERDGSYTFEIFPAFDDFPGDDPVADTRRYVELMERHIRTCPEQYFWIHRKFKNLPDGYPDYYEDL
jgi:KDO2-lipid IV(A) lauroyltransferase